MSFLAIFRSTYSHEDEELPGRNFVELLTAHLVQSGFGITPRGETEYAHTFVGTAGSRTFLVEPSVPT